MLITVILLLSEEEMGIPVGLSGSKGVGCGPAAWLRGNVVQ